MSVVASGMSMGTRVWLAAGTTDMRKGFTGLSALKWKPGLTSFGK